MKVFPKNLRPLISLLFLTIVKSISRQYKLIHLLATYAVCCEEINNRSTFLSLAEKYHGDLLLLKLFSEFSFHRLVFVPGLKQEEWNSQRCY